MATTFIDEATAKGFSVEGTKIKFQGTADLKSDIVEIVNVEPFGSASRPGTPDNWKVNFDDWGTEPEAGAVVNKKVVVGPPGNVNVDAKKGAETVNVTGEGLNMGNGEPQELGMGDGLKVTGPEAGAVMQNPSTLGKTTKIPNDDEADKKWVSNRNKNGKPIQPTIESDVSVEELPGGKTKKRRHRRKYRGSAKKRRSGKRV